MAKKIFVVAGISYAQSAGNQVYKNTIYYLAKAGFSINAFAFTPYTAQVTPFDGIESIFHGAPKMCRWIYGAGRLLKNLCGKRYKKKEESRRGVPDVYFLSNKTVAYFEKYTPIGHVFYFISWVFYLIFEIPRVIYFSLKEHPDLYYGFEIYGARAASIVARLFKKPVITRFQGTCLLPDKSNWRYLPHHVFGLRSFADAIIMANDGTHGDKVLEVLGVNKKKVCFLMDGIDGGLFSSVNVAATHLVEKVRRENKKIILSACKLKLWKRIDRAIYILSELKRRYQLQDICLFIIGDGEERENLKAFAQYLNLTDDIVFLGGLPHDDVGSFFSVADLYVGVSDIGNLNNPLLEALSCGCPILTINDRSTDGLLLHDYSAFLAAPQKLDRDLVEGAYKILTDQTYAEKLKKGAKLAAEKNILFWNKRMDKEIAIIQNIITSYANTDDRS